MGLLSATGWIVQPGTVLVAAGAALAIILGWASVASRPVVQDDSEPAYLDLRPVTVRSSYEELAADNLTLRARDAAWATDNAALRERVAVLSARNAALERRTRELEASLAETVGYLDTVRRRASRPLATRAASAPAPRRVTRAASRRALGLAAGSGARAALDAVARVAQLALARIALSLAAVRERAHERWVALVRKALL